MQRRVTLAAVSLVMLSATSTHAGECTAATLLGTWKQVKARFGGQENTPTASSQEIKLVTPTHFTWVNFDPTTGKVNAAGGGTYTASGIVYVENVEFAFGGPDVESLSKKQFQYSCSISGNTWSIKGTVLGSPLEETLERVEPR